MIGLWAALLALVGLDPAPPPVAPPMMVRRMIIRNQLIIRVPVQPRPIGPLAWDQRKGPKCLPVASLAAAMLSGPGSIDFVLTDRRRMRAEMNEDCPALDFYTGFYLQPGDDQMLCREREQIRSRAGTACTVRRFFELVPPARR